MLNFLLTSWDQKEFWKITASVKKIFNALEVVCKKQNVKQVIWKKQKTPKCSQQESNLSLSATQSGALPQVIYFVSLCQNYLETDYGTQHKILNINSKITVVVHVLQTTRQNLVISRCCFAEDGKEMYQEL